MGCRVSRPSGPEFPHGGGAPPASSRVVVVVSADDAATESQQPPSSAARPTTGGSHNSRRQSRPADGSQPTSPLSQTPRQHRERRPLDQHINKPLRPHGWTSKSRRWTRARLDRERIDFFDTRVAGRPEVWQTLRAALEALWSTPAEAETEEDEEGAGGIILAQTILDAAEITLPTGNLANGAYDALGNYYPIPEWIVSDPTNLASDDEEEAKHNEDIKAIVGVDETEASAEDEASNTRQEKGKAVEDVTRLLTVVARLSETARDVTVSFDKGESVRNVERKILVEAQLPDNRKVRLAYMGKILNPQVSLDAQGWKTDHIVNALVFPR